MKAWDLGDEANPQPNVWPECPTCLAPYAYRHVFTLASGSWLWTRDCKHKAAAVLMTADGPYEGASA